MRPSSPLESERLARAGREKLQLLVAARRGGQPPQDLRVLQLARGKCCPAAQDRDAVDGTQLDRRHPLTVQRYAWISASQTGLRSWLAAAAESDARRRWPWRERAPTSPCFPERRPSSRRPHCKL